MRNVCLIDLDDVLVDFRTPMVSIVNGITGLDTKWESYDIPDECGLTHSEFIKIMIDEDILNKVKTNDGSHGFLRDLHALDLYTVIVTARGWHPEGKEITEWWIADNELHVDDLIIVDAHQSKTDVIGRFGEDIVFSVDDRMKHCREYSQTGKLDHVFLYDAIWNAGKGSWNRDWNGHDYDKRVFYLDEITDHIMREK